jgi:hypothetical protein
MRSMDYGEVTENQSMFISLNVEPETHEAAVAALDALCAELGCVLPTDPLRETSFALRPNGVIGEVGPRYGPDQVGR